MSNKPKLSIIIVSWNVRELLEKCLVSIEKYRRGLDLEIIVIDNNSTDGSQEMIANFKSQIANLKTIFINENLGFAKGNNKGLEWAKGEYALFLNPDTEVVGDALAEMVRYMDTHPEVGAIGPKLLNSDESLQRSVRAFPTLVSQLLILTKLHNFIPRIAPLKVYFQLDFDYETERDVDQVMGAALLVRKSILDEVGSFDAGYKRIFEEVDLCFRIKHAGHTIRYIPIARIIHHKGASFTQQRICQKQLDFNQGMLRFFKKHKSVWQYVVLYLFQPISWLATLFVMLVGIPFRKKFKKTDL